MVLRAVLLLSSLAALEKTATYFSGNAEGPFCIFGPIVRPILLLSVVLVSLGVMGRLAALPILLLSGLWISRQGSDPMWCLLMVAAAGLLITGSGNLSLWQPEEKYLVCRVRAQFEFWFFRLTFFYHLGDWPFSCYEK